MSSGRDVALSMYRYIKGSLYNDISRYIGIYIKIGTAGK